MTRERLIAVSVCQALHDNDMRIHDTPAHQIWDILEEDIKGIFERHNIETDIEI